MDYNKLTSTDNTVSIKTKFQIKELPEYVGPRGGKYYFDFCYFGSCNFDVYKERATRDVRVAINVNGYA